MTLRGNNGQRIFDSDQDRRDFVHDLGEAVRRHSCRIHGYCLMSNHVHVALQVGEKSLSKIVQTLAQHHALRMNRRRGGRGHLFQARFHSVQVQREAQVLETIRYIHLNPLLLGRSESALSRGVARLDEESLRDPDLRGRLDAVLREVSALPSRPDSGALFVPILVARAKPAMPKNASL